MKPNRIRSSNWCILVVLITLGCSDEPSVQEKTTVTLSSVEWNRPVVMVDGVDQSVLYQNFSIRFDKSNYTTKGGSPLWPAAGTWKFSDENARTMLFDGQMEVTISEISKSVLELTVINAKTTFSEGRVSSISGKNIFRLKSG